MSSPMSDYRLAPPTRKRRGQKKHWQMSPLKLLARHVVARRGKPFPSYIVTRTLVREFRYAFNMGWNVTVGIEGRAGEGKSEIAQSLALFLWLPLTKGIFHYFFDIDEVPDNVKDGCWQHMDEWIIPEGAGKIQAINRYRNICNVSSRAKMICNSVTTPQLPELMFLTVFITTLAQERTLKINLVEIRVPLPRHGLVYIGNAEIPLHKQEEIREKYEKDAYERKTGLLDDKGSKKIKPKIDRISTAEFVLKWAREKGYQIRTKGQAASILSTVAELEGWDINYDEENRIANIMTARIEGTKDAIKVPDYVGQTADLQSAIFARLPDYGIDAQSIDYLKMYLKGNLQSDIATKEGVTQPCVSDRIGAQSPLREGGILGFAFEDVWKARLEEEGHIVHKGGKNTPSPDIVLLKDVIPNEKFIDEWWLEEEIVENILEVHSVKCYLDKKQTTTMKRSELAKSELELFNQGKPLTLIYYDLYTDKLFQVPVSDQEKFSFKKKV